MAQKKIRAAQNTGNSKPTAGTVKKSAVPKTNKRLYDGPRGWLFPMLESAYTKLIPKAQAAEEEKKAARRGKTIAGKADGFSSTYQAGRSSEIFAPVARGHWLDRIREYHLRKAPAVRGPAMLGAAPGAPAIPGGKNWTSIGPTVVEHGQAQGRPAISGRVAGIAVAPGGLRVYVATANGGVWRSDDSGTTWKSTMDGFDADPTAFASTSLACGAIAISPSNPDRVYVGTGEGNTDSMFQNRTVNALPAYRGIGPVRSDNGGADWVSETSTPSLAGFSFFEIAVDPANGDHCVAATSNGLYERVAAAGGFQWTRRRPGIYCSAVAARAAGTTRWFAVVMGGAVETSTDGTNWTAAGTSFPASRGRTALGVQSTNPNVLYALVTTPAGALKGVFRLNNATGPWRQIAGAPPLLPGKQGDYDLCIVVDPNNANRIYMGGDYFEDNDLFPGSIWRGTVSGSGSTLSMTATSIGRAAHADVHVLEMAPGNSNALWVGTDGGVFFNGAPSTAAGFASRNDGLATLCTNYFAQHPTDPGILYVGLQDNGSAKRIAGSRWRHILFADGGYCIVNWATPDQVLTFANGNIFRATDGGVDYDSWSRVTPPGAEWATMAEPLVGAPLNPAAPADAAVAAIGSATNGRPCVFISSDFGVSWPVRVDLPTDAGSVISMVFASAARIFLGTTKGRVFRLDKGAAGWTTQRLDNAAGGSLGLAGLIWDIAVDTTDAARNSIYVCFGGSGDFRHVWRYNGTAWQARSGAAGSTTSLLDVEHNAIQMDAATGRLFVGADIGVWSSSDGGVNWSVMQNGLPDAPVFDLQILHAGRKLRASLHGRGLFEWDLN